MISKNEKFCIEIFKHKSYLKNYARKFLNMQDVDDIIQDVFIKAMRYSENENNSVKTLLTTILKNEVINNSRKTSNKVKKVDINDCNQYYIQEYDFILCIKINKKLGEIGENLSKPFMLFCDGYKYEEIAKELNIELHAVKSNIYRCREILKKFIMEAKNKKIVNVSDAKTIVKVREIRENKKNRKKTIIKNVSH